MKQRLITGFCLAVMTTALIWIGGIPLSLALMGIVAVSMYEEFHVLNVSGHHPVAWPTWLGLLIGLPLTMIFGVKMVIPALMAIALVTLLCVLYRKEPKLDELLSSMLPMTTVMLPGLCLLSLLAIEPAQVQRTYETLVITVPCIGDVAAYAIGSTVRGPKLCPAVSPNKTISGSIAGLLASIITGVTVCGLARAMCAAEVLPLLPLWWHGLLLGLLGGVAGQLGDLCFSLIKRHCGIKDYSNIFPGHGGMLDRMDSILFMAIVVFCYRLITVL